MWCRASGRAATHRTRPLIDPDAVCAHTDTRPSNVPSTTVQTPRKTNFRGALRYAPLQIFGPTLLRYGRFSSRAHAKEKRSRNMPSPNTRDALRSGRSCVELVRELLVLLGVSCAERIGNYLCVSPAHRQRTAPGAAFAVSWNVFGERRRARRAREENFRVFIVTS